MWNIFVFSKPIQLIASHTSFVLMIWWQIPVWKDTNTDIKSFVFEHLGSQVLKPLQTADDISYVIDTNVVSTLDLRLSPFRWVC